MSDNQRPAASQAADPTEDAPSALEAVQAALDRRDNGGAAGRLPPRPLRSSRTLRTPPLTAASS